MKRMLVEHSNYWKAKRKYRSEITDDFIEYAIQNSNVLNDRKWEDLFNAIARVPTNGRKLKVVYRRKGKNNIEVITSYWID
jgi:hypothetical protein